MRMCLLQKNNQNLAHLLKNSFFLGIIIRDLRIIRFTLPVSEVSGNVSFGESYMEDKQIFEKRWLLATSEQRRNTMP